MGMKSLGLSPQLHQYLVSVSVREAPILEKIRRETATHPRVAMQIAPEQGQFLDFLIRLIQPRRVLEIGIFTGYSSTCMALAMPAKARLVACEISPEYARTASAYWEEAGISENIDLWLGPALESLRKLASDDFDLAFIDADKGNLEGYFEQCLRLVRPGGIIAIDNVLWSGRVADPSENDEDTRAIRALNQKLHQDARIDLVTLAISDGLTLARRR